MKPQAKADIAMLMVTLFWGSSYLFMQMGLTDLQAYNLIGLRFGIAFFLAALLFHRRVLKPDRKTVLHALVLGAILFAVFAAITSGMKSTTISHAGFLVSLTVIFVPLLSIALRNKPEARVFAGAGLAIVGIGLLTLTDEFQINQGDALCVLGAFFYAVHIIVTGKWASQSDGIKLGAYQLGFAGAFGFIFSLVLETPRLPHTSQAWLAILALSILCSAIGFIVQTVAQKYTTPTHAGLIFSLEPVFAACFAFLLTGETLSPRGYLGAFLVLLSVLIAEFDLRKLFRSRKTDAIPVSSDNLPV